MIRYYPLIILFIIIFGLYYKLFLLGDIPFPGDLLVSSYSPWFDYYKIPVQNPLISDVFSQLILWKYLAIDIFKTSQFPLWNPYSFTGNPLLANYQSATLNPFNILLFLPKYIGWGIFIFMQTLLAATFMFLLLTLYVKSNLARILGALIFSLSGLMTTWVELGTAVYAMALLPLGFYSLEKFYKEFKFRYLYLLIFCLTVTFLSGNAQIFTYSFILLTIFTLIKFRKNKDFKNLIPLGGLIFSIILVSLQLLPTLDLMGKSIRSGENYIGQSNFGLLPLADFTKFFMADFWGNPITRNYWGSLNYFEASGFIGTLSLPLVLFSIIFLRKNNQLRFFIYLTLFTLIFIFDNPLSKFIYQLNIPLLTSSFASRLLFITSFACSILSAVALDFVKDEKQQTKLVKTTLWSLSAILGAVLGIFLSYLILKLNIYLSPSETLANFMKYDLTNFNVSLKNSLLPISLTSLVLLILSFHSKIGIFKNRVKLICLILAVLIIFDLGRYFLKFNPFVDQKLIFPEVKEMTFLKNQPGLFRVGREHAEILPPNTWTAYNIQSFEGYDPLYLRSYGRFINFLNTDGFEDDNLSRYAELSNKYQSPLIDMLNVRYFVGILRDKEGRIPGDELYYKLKETDYHTIFKGKSFVLLENPHALNRVYLAKSIIKSKNAEEEITKGNFDPRITTILSDDLGVNNLSGQGEINITDYSPNLVKIITQTNQDEILVLSDQFEDGWKATIDGAQTTIVKANLIFRAIRIPAGKHHIEFNYFPNSFEIGLKISGISLVILLLGLVFSIRNKFF